MNRRHLLTVTATITIATVMALPILTYPLVPDHGTFATIGRGILQGQSPYVELWDAKPPAVYYVYSLIIWLFGGSAVALRTIDLLLLPIMGSALYSIALRLANRA